MNLVQRRAIYDFIASFIFMACWLGVWIAGTLGLVAFVAALAVLIAVLT